MDYNGIVLPLVFPFAAAENVCALVKNKMNINVGCRATNISIPRFIRNMVSRNLM